MIATISRVFSIKNLVVDVILLTVVYFIPALSHVCPVPVYLFDPMRIVLFTGFLLTRNNVNALFLALTIPVFSSILIGHPPIFKALLISVELTVNIGLILIFLNRTKWHPGVVLFVSIILSKIVYYGLKYILIQTGFIEGELLSTSLYIQGGVIALITVVFSLLYMKLCNRKVLNNRQL